MSVLQVSTSCYETIWQRLEPVLINCPCGVSLCAAASPALLTGHWRTRLTSSSPHFSQMNWSVLSASITASWTVHRNCIAMKEAGEGSTVDLVRVCCVRYLPTLWCWLCLKTLDSCSTDTCSNRSAQNIIRLKWIYVYISMRYYAFAIYHRLHIQGGQQNWHHFL